MARATIAELEAMLNCDDEQKIVVLSNGEVRAMPLDQESSPQTPFYFKFRQDDDAATPHYGITCNEGWRESIVCTGMYGWAADWLVGQLQGKPFAPETRP